MFVKVLFCEDYNDIPNCGKVIDNPTWENIRDAILELNGESKSTVVLRRGYDDEYEELMGVGGGGDQGLYICFMGSQKPDEPEWRLHDPSRVSEEPVEIVAGELTWYPRSSCVSLNEVLKAAETYSVFGERDKTLAWEAI
jgi:hypothetical protein